MKKNGFTLVEILVSISLISVVLVTLLNSLVKIKDVYLKADEDTDIRLTNAIISRTINNDIKENGGINGGFNCIREINDDETVIKNTCEFSLRNGQKRELNVYLIIYKENIENNRTLNNNRSTVEYKDLDNDEILLIKTISSTEVQNEDYIYSSTNYHFKTITDMENNGIIKYTDGTKSDVLVKLVIEASDPEFNIVILSAHSES